MSRRHLDIDPRAEELLVDQVVSGLDQQRQAELDALLADEAEELQAELMQTAALVQLGTLLPQNGRLLEELKVGPAGCPRAAGCRPEPVRGNRAFGGKIPSTRETYSNVLRQLESNVRREHRRERQDPDPTQKQYRP